MGGEEKKTKKRWIVSLMQSLMIGINEIWKKCQSFQLQTGRRLNFEGTFRLFMSSVFASSSAERQ